MSEIFVVASGVVKIETVTIDINLMIYDTITLYSFLYLCKEGHLRFDNVAEQLNNKNSY